MYIAQSRGISSNSKIPSSITHRCLVSFVFQVDIWVWWQVYQVLAQVFRLSLSLSFPGTQILELEVDWVSNLSAKTHWVIEFRVAHSRLMFFEAYPYLTKFLTVYFSTEEVFSVFQTRTKLAKFLLCSIVRSHFWPVTDRSYRKLFWVLSDRDAQSYFDWFSCFKENQAKSINNPKCPKNELWLLLLKK